MESNQPHQPITIHLITHNHWDREWIFTAKYANRWLPTFFDNLFAMLEKEPTYRFVLDGQTLIIEDYLRQLPPDQVAAKKRELRHFTQSGQLLIGPAYLQPDWSLVSGESLVRNLLIGCKMAQEYGSVMRAGWLLDNFGQVAQAPQIFKGFNIEGAFVWRGIDMPIDNIKTEFWWEASDGSRILGIYLLDSYRNAMVLNITRDIAEERILSHTRTLRRFATTPNVLLMNGYEQVPEPDDILTIIDDLNSRIVPRMQALQSTPPDYLAAVRRHQPDLPVLKGYQYSGRFAPILKGVYSSRSYLNQLNNECQRELERWAEKFNTFAWVFGHDYPERRFELAWKTLLQNQTHDDLCGCCVDPIARDMLERFDEVRHYAHTMSSESLQAIVQTVDTSRSAVTAIIIFNPSSRPRRETAGLSLEIPEALETFHVQDSDGHVIPKQILKRIGDRVDLYLWTTHLVPSVGYRAYYVVPGTQEPDEHPSVEASADNNTMENQYLYARINNNGTLTIREKNRGDVYENLGYFEDGGDAGDTYDYSNPVEDNVITSLGETAEITLEEAGPLIARFRVELKLRLPRSLTKDRTGRTSKTRKVSIVSFIELTANAGHIEIRTAINNVIKDHRIRVMFPCNIQTNFAYAGMPFDVAKYPIVDNAESNSIPEALEDLMLAGRYKVPVNTRPFQHFISLVDETSSMTVFSLGLNEFEVLPENSVIALTLLRGVGWLARADLLTRDGDVGPHIFTPEAQVLGKQVFEYSIYPHGGDLRQANPHFESDRHTLKFRAVQTDTHKGRLPGEFSFLGWSDEEPEGALKLTAIKQSEEGDSVIIRFYNAFDDTAKAFIQLGGHVTEAWRTNMEEKNLRQLQVNNGRVPIKVSGHEIVTIKVKFRPWKLIEDFRRHPVTIAPLSKPTFHVLGGKKPPLVTTDEVNREKTRATQLAAALQAIRSEVYILNEEMERRAEMDLPQLVLLHRLKGREATLAREYHEARISALLNHQLLVTLQVEKELDEIGASLNWARVRKRVGEFLSHYYERQLKESE